jgi:hypothetical protein
MTYLPSALQVPLHSSMVGAVVPTGVGSSSSNGGGEEPASKRVCPWSLLLASIQYVCGVVFRGMPLPLPTFWIVGFEGNYCVE